MMPNQGPGQLVSFSFYEPHLQFYVRYLIIVDNGLIC